MSGEIWTEKYAPKHSKEVIAQELAIRRIKDFIENYDEQEDKALLLIGLTGTGKTCTVHAIAREMNLELIELNASDKRNASQIKEIVGSASKQKSLFGKKKLILIDEIDGISGMEDRGGIGELIKIIKESSVPIILTANDPWDPKLRSLRNYVSIVEFKKIGVRDIVRLLSMICEREGIEIDRESLIEIANMSRGDLRSAINDLQMLCMNKKKIKHKDLEVLSYRERERNIFEALGMVFKTSDAKTALRAFDNVDKEIDELILWIAENITKEYEKPEEIAKAYDYISRADVFLGRINRWQYHRFIVYANALMTAGVAISKKQMYRKFTSYKSPSKISSMFRSKEIRSVKKHILFEIAKNTHTSTSAASKFYLPYIKFIFKNNRKIAEIFKNQFNLSREEIEFLKY
ncbi:MAG: replication factor C large subunit [Candidatus Nanoarchaeia archaeon]|nr:replication factor C large subunit [Candidatus Jingweiarchaeum tengchongense]